MRVRNIAADATLVAATTLLLVLEAVEVTVSWGPRYWPLSGATAALVAAATLLTRHTTPRLPGATGRAARTATAPVAPGTAGDRPAPPVGTARGRLALAATAAAMLLAAAAMVVAHLAHLPTEPAPATTLGLAVLVALAVRHRPPLAAAAVAAAGLAIAVASRLLTLPTSSHVISTLAAAGWLAATAAGLALRLRDTRRRDAADAVRREERLALARELHDVVAHHITGIVLQAQAAQLLVTDHPTDPHHPAPSPAPLTTPPTHAPNRLAGPAGGERERATGTPGPERAAGPADGERERLVGVLAGIEGAGSEALAAMRRVVGVLRDGRAVPAGPAVPGAGEFGELVRRFEGQGFPVRVTWPADGLGAGWPPEVTSTVYRIVQEALTNVSQHATRAGAVSVAVERAPGAVSVEVSDDAPAGPGRLGHRGGYGLVGMRERVETLGGTLVAGPRPGAGWTVRATLPVPANAGASR